MDILSFSGGGVRTVTSSNVNGAGGGGGRALLCLTELGLD